MALFQCDYNAKPHQKLKINSVKFAYNEFNVIYIANQYYLKKYSILIFKRYLRISWRKYHDDCLLVIIYRNKVRVLCIIIYRFLIFVSLYLPYCLCQYSVFNFIQNQKHIYNDDFKGLFQQLPNPCVDLGGGVDKHPSPSYKFQT